MRGKVFTVGGVGGDSGITPAYAGKSFAHFFQVCFAGDHPRVCGEKRNTLMPFSSGMGSPPRMRGKVSAFRTFYQLDGITPAYAGKS